MTIFIYFLLSIHVIVSLLLLLIVLMQRPRSEGLGTAFGSAVTDTLFGSSTGNVLTKITSWLGVIFFLTTISLAWCYSHEHTSSIRNTLAAPIANSSSTNAAPAAVAVTSSNVPLNVVRTPASEAPTAPAKPAASAPTPTSKK